MAFAVNVVKVISRMAWSAEAYVEKSPAVPAPLIALAGWVLPGAGYWLLGQKSRALVVGITIICIWIMGLLIGGVRVIEVPKFNDQGQYIGPPEFRVNPANRQQAMRVGGATLIEELRDKPWSIAQVMIGPVAVVSGGLSIYAARPADPAISSEPRAPIPHARMWEIPVLYTAVAGMLNLIVLIDAAHRARHRESGV